MDAFDFVLAEALGKSLQEIRDMPNTDYLQWQAFYVYRNAQQKLNRNNNDG